MKKMSGKPARKRKANAALAAAVFSFFTFGSQAWAAPGVKTVWHIDVLEKGASRSVPVGSVDYSASFLSDGKIFELNAGLLDFYGSNVVPARASGGDPHSVGLHGHLMFSLQHLKLGRRQSDFEGILSLTVIDSSGLPKNAAAYRASFSFSQSVHVKQSQSLIFTLGDNSVPGQSAKYEAVVTFVRAESCDDDSSCIGK